MSFNFPPSTNPLNLTQQAPVDTIYAQRDPAVTDNFYSANQEWKNTVTGDVFKFIKNNIVSNQAQALWVQYVSGTSGANVQLLKGNSGGDVGPDGDGRINILGSDTTTVVGTPGSNLLTVTATSGGYPITPFVVGPAGKAGYQTIQSAVNAAIAAGGGTIFIQGGTYTENLNLTGGGSVSFTGEDQGVLIIGVHTPPTSGTITFDNLVLQSATDILNSAAAGTTIINFNNCFFIITNGYVFNLLNWTGELLVDNCGEASTNDGVVNNTGGSQIKFINAELGAGTGNSMVLTGNGNLRFDTCNINCPVNIGGSGTLVMQNGSVFRGTVTIGGSKTSTIIETCFLTGSAAAITYSSSGAGYISGATIDSTNNPAITGAGAGALSLIGIWFINNSSVAGTLNIAVKNSFNNLGGTSIASSASSVVTWDVRNTSASNQALISCVGASNGFFSSGNTTTPAFWNFGNTPATGLFNIARNSSQTDPTFGTIIFTSDTSGNITIPSGDFTISRSSSGGAVIAQIINTSNTANSRATLTVQSGGASGGDAAVFTGYSNTNSWTIGQDISDAEAWKLSRGNILGTNDAIKVTPLGAMTKPLQPSFSAYNSTARSNVTGDGTTYTLIFNTEQFDQAANFDGTSTFTAPVTGRYRFNSTVSLTSLAVGHTSCIFALVNSTSGVVYYGQVINPGAIRDASNGATVHLSKLVPLAASDQVIVQVTVSNSTKTVGIDNTAIVTSFDGDLLE